MRRLEQVLRQGWPAAALERTGEFVPVVGTSAFSRGLTAASFAYSTDVIVQVLARTIATMTTLGYTSAAKSLTGVLQGLTEEVDPNGTD